MNELQVFQNEKFGQVRTIEEEGKILFCGSDVARALGYARPNEAIAKHCKGTLKRRTPTAGGIQEMLFISEGDVYRLLAHSKLPAAQEFEHWLFDGVVPSIRQHGAYIMGQESMDDDLLLAKAVLAANNMIEERNKKIAQLEVSIAQLTPAADYCQEVLQSENLISTTEIAKDFGFRSAQQLNKILSDLNIQYKVNDSWALRAEYADKGYVKTKTFTYQYGSQKATAQHNYWTEQGRKFLYEKLKKNNLLPKSFQQFLKRKSEEVLPC